jgi:hypothetical protein
VEKGGRLWSRVIISYEHEPIYQQLRDIYIKHWEVYMSLTKDKAPVHKRDLQDVVDYPMLEKTQF